MPDYDNEKEVKIRQQQTAKFQQFLFLFFLLSVVAFILGHSQDANTNNHDAGDAVRFNPNNEHVVKSAASGAAAAADKKIPQLQQQQAPSSKNSGPSLAELQSRVNDLDAQVRAHKALPNMIMETDPTGMKLTKELQHVTHQLLVKRYGTSPKRVVVHVVFPKSIPDYTEDTASDTFIIEMAPHELIPCSVFYFLELARTWKYGSVHRNAGHVLQIQSHSSEVHKSMPFQEYSPEFPHKQFTTGYAGRPSGPGWYVSILDNTRNHGPGSQQQHNPHEADANFGTVIQGSQDVIPRIHSVPQRGWLDKENHIQIPTLTILTPKYDEEGGQIVDWVPWVEE